MDKRFIGILLILSSIGVLVYGAITYSSRINTTPVSLLVSPDKTEIAVGDKKVTGSQIIHLKPGKYEFKATRNGFEGQTITTEIKNNPVKIIFSLKPLTKEANKEVQSASKVSEIDNVTTKALADEQQELEKNNPIIKKLPIKNLIYSIGYKMDPSRVNSIIIEIDAPEGYRNAAINEIRKQGFDPAKLNITFRDYANTFTE